jgi:oligoendopeptidase F
MSTQNHEKDFWDLSFFLSSDDDPKIDDLNKDLIEVNKKFIENWKDREDYLEDPGAMKEALDEFEKLDASPGQVGKVFSYFSYRRQQDSEDPVLKAKYNKSYELVRDLSNETMFFTHKISKINEKDQEKFLSSELLVDYRHFLENLFKSARYLLTEPEEKIINLVAKTSTSNWSTMVMEFLNKEERVILDEDEKEKKKNFSEILKYSTDKNKKVRDKAAGVLNEILDRHSDPAVAEMNSLMEFKKTMDELRGFERPDSARHFGDDIESEVVDALVEAVTDKFDTSGRYYEIKSKLFKVDKLEYHERAVEYGEVERKYPYNDSVGLVKEVFRDLDEEFYDIYQSMLNEGRFDVYPRKGKRAGAFCMQVLKDYPVYILLNHQEKLRDVLTIAHEMGHAINDHLISKEQSSLNAGTLLSTAEVSSTFFEDFVFERLLKDVDDEEKLILMMSKLDDSISTIHRQVGCYNFETQLHKEFREKGYLPKEDVNGLFTKNMSAYMGDYVEQSKGSENWWVYWSHIRNYFYVYSYASGLLISKAMQRMVREDPGNINKVKEFLSSGTFASPKEIFMKMDIDISDPSFWKNGLDEVDGLLKDTEELAKKLGKI